MPQPEGPIRAVVLFGLKLRLTSNRACFSPYDRSRFLVDIFMSSIFILLDFVGLLNFARNEGVGSCERSVAI